MCGSANESKPPCWPCKHYISEVKWRGDGYVQDEFCSEGIAGFPYVVDCDALSTEAGTDWEVSQE